MLCLDGVGTGGRASRIDLTLRRGEILGLAGLVGAGRTELLRAVYGLDPIVSGRVTVAGYSGRKRLPADRLVQGIGLLSENRQAEGLALGLSVGHNLLLSHLTPFARWGWLADRPDAARCRAMDG